MKTPATSLLPPVPKSRSLGGVRFAAIAALMTLASCDSGGGNGMVHSAKFTCSAAGVIAADTVGVTCGGTTDSITETVDVVVIGTPTGSTTARGFNFDVTYDPSSLEFVPSTSNLSPLFPDALIAVGLFNGTQGRLVVSVQQPGGLPDVTIGAGQQTILALSFRRVSGATFGPTPLTIENADATGASASVTFVSTLKLAYQ
jgi:hypothetical protein